MNGCTKLEASVNTPSVNAFTFPSGPRGAGIKSVSQTGNSIIFTFDDDVVEQFIFPEWWFGTRHEYNSLSAAEKTSKMLYFIQEGT